MGWCSSTKRGTSAVVAVTSSADHTGEVVYQWVIYKDVKYNHTILQRKKRASLILTTFLTEKRRCSSRSHTKPVLLRLWLRFDSICIFEKCGLPRDFGVVVSFPRYARQNCIYLFVCLFFVFGCFLIYFVLSL